MKAKKHWIKIMLFLCMCITIIPMVTIEIGAAEGDACAYCGHKPLWADPYDEYGKCEKCKKDYDYQSSRKSASGIFVTKKEIEMSPTPYGADKNGFKIAKGEIIEPVASCTNAKKHLWYEVKYDNGKTGYIYEENLDLVVEGKNIYSVSGAVNIILDKHLITYEYRTAPSTNAKKIGDLSLDELEVSRLVKDTANIWWYYGYSYTFYRYAWIKCIPSMDVKYTQYNQETKSIIQGSDLPSSISNTSRELNYNVKTSKAKISQVSAAIYSGSNTSGTLVMGGNWHTINATSTNIKSNAGKDIAFQNLTPGKQYTLQISVKLIGDKYYNQGSVTDYTYTVSKSWTFTVNCSHSYSSSYTKDANNHWKTCTICGAAGSKSGHSFSTTSDSNYHWKKCSTCGYTTSKTGHSFSTDYNSSQHWQKCSCGYTKSTASHSMSSSYSHDSSGHWKKCSSCNYTTTKTAHTLTADNNSTYHWQTCSCGYTTTKTAHTLTTNNNSTYHWQACSCGYTTTKTAHTLTADNNATYHWQACSCGYTTTKNAHTLTTNNNATYHWQACSCGYTTSKTSHSFSTDYNSSQHWQECSCGYTTTKTAHTLTTNNNSTYHWQECSCGYTTTKTAHALTTSNNSTYHWQECSCGYTAATESHALTMDKDASYHWQKCSCGYTTAKTAHTFTQYQDQSGMWNKCTICQYKVIACAHDGATAYKTTDDNYHALVCQKCSCVLETSPHQIEISINEVAHQKACALCEYRQRSEAHSLTQQFNASAHWEACSCGYTTTPVAHSLVIDHNDQKHWEKCNECNHQTNAIAHVFGAWEIIEQAEEGKDGIKAHTCIDCDYTETTTYSIGDHVHAYTSYVTPPSCTAMGYTTHVCPCGDSYIDEKTDMVDHVSDGVWQYDENDHWQVCSECEQIINLAAHQKSQWIIDPEADVDVEGKKHIECLVCKAVLENETIDPIPPKKEDKDLSFAEYIDFILNHISEYIDAIWNNIFSSKGISFFREHKYAAGVISGGAVVLAITLIIGVKRKKGKK